ncbi:MAG TPA: ABC transporter permease [Vicinamibacterales bacterium]|nr:ABC transporter permease [Vicinamibacterales bacterium]
MSTPLLLRVLTTELMKIRRTLALWMVVIAPLVVVLLNFLVAYVGAAQVAKRTPDVWAMTTRQTVALWTVLMMPLFLTLETALLAGVEHAERNWKSVLALPPPRWMFYISKLIVTTALLWTAHAVLVGGTLASGAVLSAWKPVLNIHALPLDGLLSPMLRVSATALCATTVQHWVSLRWQSFTGAMGFGMCAMVTGFIAVNSADYGPWFPWSMSMYAIRAGAAASAVAADPSSRVLLIGIAGAAVASVAGAIEFSRREIH